MSVDMFGNDPAMTQDEMYEADLITEGGELTRWGHMRMAMHSTWDDEPYCWIVGIQYDDATEYHGPFKSAEDAGKWGGRTIDPQAIRKFEIRPMWMAKP